MARPRQNARSEKLVFIVAVVAKTVNPFRQVRCQSA